MPELTLDDPRVRELDRACSRAFLDVVDAVEDAGRAGLSAEVIARYAPLPLHEIRLILKEAQESGED